MLFSQSFSRTLPNTRMKRAWTRPDGKAEALYDCDSHVVDAHENSFHDISPPSPLVHLMRVLCVAEKASIARSITQILSGGQFATVSATLCSHLSGPAEPPCSERVPTNISRILTSIITTRIHSLPSHPLRDTCLNMTSNRNTRPGVLVILLSSSTRLYAQRSGKTLRQSRETLQMNPGGRKPS